jgi:hypothetical protein
MWPVRDPILDLTIRETKTAARINMLSTAAGTTNVAMSGMAAPSRYAIADPMPAARSRPAT